MPATATKPRGTGRATGTRGDRPRCLVPESLAAFARLDLAGQLVTHWDGYRAWLQLRPEGLPTRTWDPDYSAPLTEADLEKRHRSAVRAMERLQKQVQLAVADATEGRFWADVRQWLDAFRFLAGDYMTVTRTERARGEKLQPFTLETTTVARALPPVFDEWFGAVVGDALDWLGDEKDRRCLVCGQELEAQRSTRRFCSDRHRAAWTDRRKGSSIISEKAGLTEETAVY
jgi:hypothetical protein